MKTKRPGSVLTIAILHLVGGGLGLIGGICAGIALFMQSALTKTMASANPQDLSVRLQTHLAQQLPWANTVQIVELLIDFMLCVMLITAGIGLLSMNNWARILSFVYAGISILNRLFAIGFFLAVTWPVMSAFLDAEIKAAPARAAANSANLVKFTTLGGAVFGHIFIVYPIVVLIVLSRRSVRLAFAEQPRDDREDDEDDDDRQGPSTSSGEDDDYDDRRRPPRSDRFRT